MFSVTLLGPPLDAEVIIDDYEYRIVIDGGVTVEFIVSEYEHRVLIERLY